MKIRRKERVSVCQKIKEIHGLQPANILKTYLDSTASFFDMQDILSKMKIPCIMTDFSELEEDLNLSKDDAIWGLAASRGENLIIVYSKKLDSSMRNYVLAHELGHCCLHLPASTEFHVELKAGKDFYSFYPDSSISLQKRLWMRGYSSLKGFLSKESEADNFAIQLLPPDFQLGKYQNGNSLLTTQHTSEVRNIILPFVNELCTDVHFEDSLPLAPILPKIESKHAKQAIPKLYRNIGIVTMSSCVLGFIMMFIDAIYSLLGLSPLAYIIWCLSCLSLFFTNKIALAEWKSINE